MHKDSIREQINVLLMLIYNVTEGFSLEPQKPGMLSQVRFSHAYREASC